MARIFEQKTVRICSDSKIMQVDITSCAKAGGHQGEDCKSGYGAPKLWKTIGEESGCWLLETRISVVLGLGHE